MGVKGGDVFKAVLCLAAVSSSLLLGGCAAYKLQGTVIEGKQSQIMVVNQSDPRLAQRGLGGVAITVTQSPKSLGRKVVGRGQSDGRGHFSIPISTFGAGFLEYQMGILARRSAHRPAVRDMLLPGSDKRLLIEMAPGHNQLSGQDGDFMNLEKTLKASEPFLNVK